VKPLDRDFCASQAAVPLFVTMEDHVLEGASAAPSLRPCRSSTARPPSSASAGPTSSSSTATSVDGLRAAHGLAPEQIYRRILDRWRRQKVERDLVGA
jgi:1-deoxy-D-xylulose-5-phosphate synthase